MPPEESKPSPSAGGPEPDRDRDLIDAAMRQATPREGEPAGTGGGSGWSGARNGDEALPSDLFPGYQLLREIHRGGQGVVYQAIHKATKKKVAIKVMREGPFASPKDRIRFEREVDILSALNHPNIVAIHDSGVASGMFFYVMDYVSGKSLDAWMAESKRTVDETLGLFAKVCDAVNAAHLKGVIHRDLKPSNIRIDSAGEPHILDFGLAKIATGSVTDRSTPEIMTITGQFVGSLPWASPEQAEGDTGKIDVRTDVYSLGVMLYQALTGRFPYEVVGNMRDVLENILRASPARPSTIRRKINDEVETIVLKCLSKERDRRYQSAGELGRDLRNYLTGQAIEAKRDSGLYVLRKVIARHRGPVFAAALLLLVVAGASVVSTVLWRREAAARVRAESAEAARTLEAQRANLYADFLDRTITSVDPDIAQGNPGVMTDVLTRAAEDAQVRLGSRPEIMGAVRDTIGRTYLAIGWPDQAELHIAAGLEARRAVGDQKEIARSLVSMGQLLLARGRSIEAETRLREALAIQTREPGAAGLDSARTLHILATALKQQGKRSESEQAFKDARVALESSSADPADLASLYNDLAQFYFFGKDYASAEPLFRKAIDVSERAFGAAHTSVAGYKSGLASLLRDRGGPGDLDQAEALLREGIAVLRKRVDPDHPSLIVFLNKLGLLLLARQNYPEAEKFIHESLDMRIRRLGPRHEYVGVSLFNLALVYRGQNRLEEATSTAEQALAVYRAANSDKERPDDYGKCLNLRADLDRRAKNYPRALERAREAAAFAKAGGPDRAPLAAGASLTLGYVLLDSGDPANAEAPFREALAFYEAKSSPTGYDAGNVRGLLGACLTALKRYDEAEPLILSSIEVIEKSRGPSQPVTLEAIDRAIVLYKAWGKPDKAGPWEARRAAAGK